MANEFKARNGFIAQKNSVITGSLIISASGTTNILQVGFDKLVVSASGNVGIGTSIPDHPVVIENTSEPQLRIFNPNSISGSQSGIRFNTGGPLWDVQLKTRQNISWLDLTDAVDTVYQRWIEDKYYVGNSTTYLQKGTGGNNIALLNGNLGIGATDPKTLLQLGSRYTFQSDTTFGFTPGWSYNGYFDGVSWKYLENGFWSSFNQTQDGLFDFYTGASGSAGGNVSGIDLRMRIENDGRLFNNASNLTTPSLTWNAAAGQIFRNETSELAFGLSSAAPFPFYIQARTNTNTARDISINALGGNVGIGKTPDPLYKLDVANPARIFGTSNTSIYLGTTAETGAGGIEIYRQGNVGYIRNHDPFVSWRDISINDQGGNVGIGCLPGNKLSVQAINPNDGIYLLGATGRRMQLMSGTPVVGNWNALTQTGDNTIIFTDGVINSGGFVLAPWSTDNGINGLRMTDTGRVGLGVAFPGAQLELSQNSAVKPGGGSWGTPSDERLKENIELADLNICYDVVKNLPLKRYTWKDSSYTDEQIGDRNVVGWIAQDVINVFPKAVTVAPFHQTDGTVIEDSFVLNETMINRTLYGATQKLIVENEELKIKVQTLESELQAIKNHLGL